MTVPVNADHGSWKPATPKNFLTANITGRGVKPNVDGTLAVSGASNLIVVTGASRNLVVQNQTSFLDSGVEITADEVALREPVSGLVYLAQNVSVTANIQGIPGNPGTIDAGVEAANTWYYVWLIYNGLTVAALLSASAKNPAMPTGYTFKALVGVVRNDASSNFLRFVSYDREVILDLQIIFTVKGAAVANVYEVLTDADLAAFRAAVPPVARYCRGVFGGTSSESSISIAACNADGTVNQDAIGASNNIQNALAGAVLDVWMCSGMFITPVRGYNFQWKCRIVTAINRVGITGFTF